MTHLGFSLAFQLVLKRVRELWISCQLHLFFSVIELVTIDYIIPDTTGQFAGRSWSLPGSLERACPGSSVMAPSDKITFCCPRRIPELVPGALLSGIGLVQTAVSLPARDS